MLGKAARFALYAVVTMARHPDRRVTARSVADRFGISENHVAKVLGQLARGGLIEGSRGVGGGYRLARPATRISMLDVVECVQGPLRPGACEDCPFRGEDVCPEAAEACRIHRVLAELSTQAYFTLKSVTIATLAGEPGQGASASAAAAAATAAKE